MRKLLNWILVRYEDSDLQVLRKSRILAYTLLVFMGITLPFGAIMLVTGAGVVGVLLFAFSGLSLGMLFVLRRGKFKAAATMLLLTLFIVMFAAIKGDQYIDVYECYVFGTLGTFLLVTSALVGIATWQPLLLMGLDLLAIAALYVLDSLPLQGFAVAALDVQSLVTSGLMVILSGIFAAISIRLQNSLIKRVEGEARSSKDQYEAMDRAIGQAQEMTQKYSAGINQAMERTISSAESMDGAIGTLRAGLSRLDAALKESSEMNRAAMERQEVVINSLGEYSTQAYKATEIVKEMAESAKVLDEGARERREAVARLQGLTVEGEDRLVELKGAIDSIYSKAGRISELSGLIGDIAQRTNMLGMNASIEASHAGVAGRGFAIVAGQIRALSEEAGKNTRTIDESLSDTKVSIEQTATANDAAATLFRRIAEEVNGVAQMLDGLLASLASIGTGARDVFASVTTVKQLCESTGKAVGESHERIGNSSSGIEQVIATAKSVASGLDNISVHFGALRRDAEAVRSLGKENAEFVEKAKKTIEGIRNT